MKVLFITFNDFYDSGYGGGQCSARNFNLLTEFSEVETIQIKKESNFKSAISIWQKNFPPLTKQTICKILKKVVQEKIPIVFLDSSLMGNIAKELSGYCKVIVFSHNVEYDYVSVRMKKSIKLIIYRILAKKNENRCLQNSDIRIMLSERDSKRSKELYGIGADYIMPITFDDIGSVQKERKRMNSENIVGIFVGAYGKSNYEGIRWFIQNVTLPDRVTIKIIGKGFEVVREELERTNVQVIGGVDDLEEYYVNADFVIVPIFHGAGMKVKTAEALMYGKTVFGTKEGFEGYSMDWKKIGALCNSTEEFEEAIHSFVVRNETRYNEYARKIFAEKYDTNVARNILKKII